MDYSRIKKRLAREEDVRLVPYQDSLGIWTVGVGHNIQCGLSAQAVEALLADNTTETPEGLRARVRQQGITGEEAMILLDLDLRSAEAELVDNLSCYEHLCELRKEVLLDMCFNLGWPRLVKFHNFLAAVQDCDWETAYDEMLDSRWARQVKGRALALAEQMRTGEEVAG